MSEAILPEKIVFNQNGFFYDMVSSFMIAIAGLEAIFNKTNPMKYTEKNVYTLEGKIHKELRIEPFTLHKLAVQEKISTPLVINNLCSMLINTAYESVKEKNDKSEIFDFFRHIRNASSHNNKFFFKNWEPIRPAKWRKQEINIALKGEKNPLFDKNCFGNFIAIADAILLLWDIEQRITE